VGCLISSNPNKVVVAPMSGLVNKANLNSEDIVPKMDKDMKNKSNL
jgi:hypothetical protein